MHELAFQFQPEIGGTNRSFAVCVLSIDERKKSSLIGDSDFANDVRMSSCEVSCTLAFDDSTHNTGFSANLYHEKGGDASSWHPMIFPFAIVALQRTLGGRDIETRSRLAGAVQSVKVPMSAQSLH